jgi:hypothetical protein
MNNFDSKQDVIEFLRELDHQGLMYHFDERAKECLSTNVVDTDVIQENVDSMLKYCESANLCPFELYYEYVY